MCGRLVGFRRLEALIQHFPIDVAKVTGERSGNYDRCRAAVGRIADRIRRVVDISP
jgi:hypothetical protein